MQTYVAEVGEIVRSVRRDEEEIQRFADRISNVIRELLGQRVWIRLHPFLITISKGAYYGATLLAGVTTLGEEYLNMYESDGLSRIAPSIYKRVLFLSLHVFVPLLSERLLFYVEKSLNHPSTHSFMGFPMKSNEKARESCIYIVRFIRNTFIPSLRRVHLTLFYLNGAYYNISRRVAGLRYISFSPQTDVEALKIYRFLGYITLVQCAVVAVMWSFAKLRYDGLKSKRKNLDVKEKQAARKDEGESEFVRPSFRCVVCLEQRPPACAPCGHVFCWYCIQEHAHSNQSENYSCCPHCRKEFEAREVVPLLNM